MASKSSKAFSAWRERTKLSYSKAAAALGLSIAAVGFYSRGTRKKADMTEKDVEVPMTVLLACSAVESDLPPIK